MPIEMVREMWIFVSAPTRKVSELHKSQECDQRREDESERISPLVYLYLYTSIFSAASINI